MAFLAWTVLVWAGRVRNVLADPALDGLRSAPAALSLSFLVPACGLAVLLVPVAAGRASPRVVGGWRGALAGLTWWTTGVWVVRAGDIALFGDHPVGFVAVHLVLAVVSVALGWTALRRWRWTGASLNIRM